MLLNKYEITDACRKKLAKYTVKAYSAIPCIKNPLILDIGCGTGVPAITLAEICEGIIYAVDPDKACIDHFMKKVNELHYGDRIKIYNASLNEIRFNADFDIILAEGLLNVIGFEKGLSGLVKFIKSKGYLIIHDELKDDSIKKDILKKYSLKLIESFKLNESAWWDDYYSCLERNIKKLNDDKLFQNEISEINDYKKNPESFRSIYYILQKEI